MLFQSHVLSFANVDAKNSVVVDALVDNLLYLAHQGAAVLFYLKVFLLIQDAHDIMCIMYRNKCMFFFFSWIHLFVISHI